MNAPEYRKRNRRLGIILSLVFVALFIVAMRIMITGNKVPPVVEAAMEGIKTLVVFFILSSLIIVAVVEIVLRVVKSRVPKNGNPE